MAKKITLIQLGYESQVAVLSIDQYSQKLTIFQEAVVEEHTSAPAVSISIYGKVGLIAIRDALNIEFPKELSNG